MVAGEPKMKTLQDYKPREFELYKVEIQKDIFFFVWIFLIRCSHTTRVEVSRGRSRNNSVLASRLALEGQKSAYMKTWNKID